MRRILCVLFLPLLLGAVVSAEEKPASPIKELAAATDAKSVKAGEEFRVTLKYDTDGSVFLSAWRLIVYKPNGPEALAGVKKFVFTEEKREPKYSFYQLLPYNWLPKPKDDAPNGGKLDLKVSTADWPAGDYNVGVEAVFHKKDGSKDLFRNTFFLITITE